jgi:arylsulfatase A
VVDDLVEFCDMMPTLCEVTGAKLPADYPGDGSSIVPVLQNKASARTKDWIYIWYRGQVMVRNTHYSLVAKTDGSNAKLTRYKGPFDGEKLADSALSEPERVIKGQFETTLARLAKTRLSGVSKEVRAQLEKPQKKRKK